jgi:predicted AlkP superfamily pyrophosphatase or phosphodiesterase
LLAACAGRTDSSQSLAQAEQTADRHQGIHGAIQHVLLISVDGLHATDVTNFVAAHPDSTFARLAGSGVEFTDAHTTMPSDSFPGMVALVTGATPKSAGVYYVPTIRHGVR